MLFLRKSSATGIPQDFGAKATSSRIQLEALSLTILYTRAQPSLKLLHARLGEHLPSARDLLKLRFLGEIARASRHFATLHDAIFVFGYFEHPPELSAKRTMLRRIRSVGRCAEQEPVAPATAGATSTCSYFPRLGRRVVARGVHFRFNA